MLSMLGVGIAQAEDVAGSADIPGIARFPDSEIVRFADEAHAPYTLGLSKVRKVNGVWQLEKKRQLNGTLQSLTYKLDKSVTADEAYAHFAEQLEALGDRVFRCKRRACGSSNQWANFVFHEKRLYGPEEGQRYLVVKAAEHYYVLYVIKRGNKRVYVRLDQVQRSAEADVAGQSERFVFDRYPLQKNAELSALARRWMLAALPKLRDSEQSIWLVAHRYGQGSESVEQLRELAANDAALLKAALVSRGIDETRIQVLAVGPLAPVNDAGGKDRLELLLFNR